VVSRISRVAFARGIDVGVVAAFDVGQRKGGLLAFDVAQGGPVLITFEARCAWSGRRSRRGARWEERPGFALVGVHQGRQ
jgi:hypothetical protein